MTPKELEAYRKYQESGKPALATSTSANFFQLFLQGHTCEEISRLNPGFGLGLIVKARIDHDWDLQREEHIQGLLDNIRQVVQKTQLDAIRFVAEGLATYQKYVGEKFQRYLQTGDAKELGEFKEMSFKTYKDLLELLMKLTGQKEEKKVTGEVTVKHQVEPISLPRVDKPMASTDAVEFLKRLDKK